MEQQNQQSKETKETKEEKPKTAYVPNDAEKHLYHVEIEKPLFDSKTGKKLSTPSIQILTEPEYNALVGKKNENDKSNAEMLGYTVTLLWNPKENK